jgi:nucleoside 2-deoxyribosyltransferase
MKVYLAGKIGTEIERSYLEKIDAACKKRGFSTFLPHRDAGLAKNIADASMIFKKDIKDGFKGCSLIIASLEGLHVGAGTAWELGYAYAKGIPAIGIKTDESIDDGFEYLSSIIVASTKIVDSFENLEEELMKFNPSDE